ncbi:leucine-rich repeat domain-containing protein [Pseudomonas fluorescens]|uniref:DUF6543 domain-containing protein n=1 Tax=Pseudomonas fluorescens TaxID=294 RepID=UPI0011322FB5|nr:DUF6543 domain-containing protein [Pseudomonas fluorescens]TMU79631.1 leucine-rich repeat domain-containing protein [Pseudomonas fluorescens]
MTGKSPKVKPVSVPTKTPDFSVEGTHRSPSASSLTPPLPRPHRVEPLHPSFAPDSVVVTPAIRVSASPISSAIDEFAMHTAKSSLADYWIPLPKNLGEADARGIRVVKQRQYVAVADDHMVQVVLDVESGLFRATLASELDPSGPLLKPDSEGRFWIPLDKSDLRNRSVNLHSMRRRTAELFFRMGHSVDDFPQVTINRILAVSGMGEKLASDSPIYSRPLALLKDTLRRFSLDRKVGLFITQMQHSDPLVRAQADPQLQALLPKREGNLVERWAQRDRALLFQKHERAFELDCDENTRQMRRIFPHLPKTTAQALWRDASAAERLHMHTRLGMPRQMAEEALLALRDVRLAKACEGIYLDSVSSPDSDRLALQMIGRLAGWPRKVRIEICQGVADGDVLGAIGDARSPIRHVLIRQDDGYVIQSSDAQLPQGNKDLYSTLWFLLLPGHRQSLGVTEGGGAALQQLIRTQPLPSRQTVGELLGLAPLPVTVDPATAPIRQAGRLRGGGDSQPEAKKSVEERVRDLYPQIPDEEVTKVINERLKSDPAGVLLRLEKEFATLRDELATWTAEGPLPHAQASEPEGAPAPAERRQAREQFSAKLQDIWQRKSVSKWGEGEHHFSHYVDFSGELPRLSSRFEYVTELILTAYGPGARLGAFLDSFPNIQSLGIVGIKVEEFPSGIFQMRQLNELTLDGCSLKLSEVTVEGLSRIETLTRLNLANNPLTVAPHVGYMAGLTGLMLNNANLSSVPSGIDKLRKLGVVALHDNNIHDAGYELFEIPDTQDLFVGLLNNPLNDASRQRISQYLESSSMDRKVEIQTEDVVSESDSDSESSESGISTGSDSD